MRTTVLIVVAALALGTALSVVAPDPVAAQIKPLDTTLPAAKLAGQWRFNKDASDDPSANTTAPLPAPGGPVSGPTPIGGGYPGGSSGGGGMGGRGGGYGGTGYGRGATPESTLRERAILRETGEAPDLLNIVVTKDTVSFTSGEGVVRKFTMNGKKEKIDLTTAKVDSITTWDQGKLTQQLKSGQAVLDRVWEPTAEGNQIVVTLTLQTSSRVKPLSKKYVYDKATAARSGFIR